MLPMLAMKDGMMPPICFITTRSILNTIQQNVKDIVTPITCIKARYNFVQAEKRDSSEANNMQAVLYICVGSEVMLT